MNWKVHLTGATVVALLACSAAGAQTRGGGSFGASMPGRVAPMRMPGTARVSGVAPARRISGPQGTRPSTVIHLQPNGRVISSNGSFANSDDFGDDIGVPGLGFDYSHLAAVSGNFRFNPPGFGRGSHHRRDFITPVFFGGFPYYSDYPDYQQEPQQPQIIVIQQPAPAATVQQAAPAAAETYTDTAAPAAPAAPVREVGELILVRRDGRVLFASVFSVTGTQVQYVTPEGIRHTLPLADLDTVATQEMTEARGTTLQFHD
jgi:hypothetical protein